MGPEEFAEQEGSIEDLREALQRVVLSHLPQIPRSSLQTWSDLARPAVALDAAGPGDPVVGRLGGLPDLPDDLPWPTWPAKDAGLSFVAQVDLSAVHALGLDTGLPGLPVDGRLLAFVCDGLYRGVNDPDVMVLMPEDRPGARLLHVTTPAARCRPRRPDDPHVPVRDEIPLTARQVLCPAPLDHPVVARAFGLPWRPGTDVAELWAGHPLATEEFVDGVLPFVTDWMQSTHLLGGWADQIQGPVEQEAWDVLTATGDTTATDEVTDLRPVLQFVPDPDWDVPPSLGWGRETWTLHWSCLTRDLSTPDRAVFTCQCP